MERIRETRTTQCQSIWNAAEGNNRESQTVWWCKFVRGCIRSSGGYLQGVPRRFIKVVGDESMTGEGVTYQDERGMRTSPVICLVPWGLEFHYATLVNAPVLSFMRTSCHQGRARSSHHNPRLLFRSGTGEGDDAGA